MTPDSPRRLVILAEGDFGFHHGKTAVGVIRYGSDPVSAVIDSTQAGGNVSSIVPDKDIPIVASLGEALAMEPRPNALLIGIAPTGGRAAPVLAGDDPRGDRCRAWTSCPASIHSSATTPSSPPPHGVPGPRSSTTADRPSGWRRPSAGRTGTAAG